MHYTPCRLLLWYYQLFFPNRTCMYELWAASYFSLLSNSNRRFSCLVWFLIKIWKQLEYRRKLSKISFVQVNFIFKLQIVMSLSKTRNHSSKIFILYEGSLFFYDRKRTIIAHLFRTQWFSTLELPESMWETLENFEEKANIKMYTLQTISLIAHCLNYVLYILIKVYVLS